MVRFRMRINIAQCDLIITARLDSMYNDTVFRQCVNSYFKYCLTLVLVFLSNEVRFKLFDFPSS